MMDQSPNDEMTLYKENPFHPLTDEGLREGQGGGGWYQCRVRLERPEPIWAQYTWVYECIDFGMVAASRYGCG